MDSNPADLDPHGKPWATAEEIDAARPATEWNPEPIEVDCVYCGHRASVSEMRTLGRPQGGMACRDIDACDARDAARDPAGLYPEET